MTKRFLAMLYALGFTFFALGQNKKVSMSNKETLLYSGTTHYILLTQNVAYFKFRRFEKPSYFTFFDTLIRKNDTLYESSTKDLIINGECYCLTLKNTSKKRNKIDFHTANAKVLRRWNDAHNIDEINKYIGEIKERELYYLNNNNELYQKMKKKLEKLLSLTDKLSPEEFKIEFNTFLEQYLK